MAKKTNGLTSASSGSKSSIFDIVKSVDKSTEILSESTTAVIKDYINTGSYILNAAMTGSLFKGVPTSRVTVLSGDPGCLYREEKVGIYVIDWLNIHHDRFDCTGNDAKIEQTEPCNYHRLTCDVMSEEIKRRVNESTKIDATEEEITKRFNEVCDEFKTIVSVEELYDTLGDKYVLVDTPDGFQPLGDMYKRKQNWIDVRTEDDFSIKVSVEHLFETPDGWKKITDLSVGDEILTKNGFKKIDGMSNTGEQDFVYDLEILHPNHRYWGGNGISSHNCGKSYLAISVCREAQKKGYTPIYMDSEGSIDTEFVTKLGCDPENFLIKQVTTIGEVSSYMANILKGINESPDDEKPKVVFVLDSLGNLTSDKELSDTIAANQKRDMTKQQEIKALFRTNATALAKAGAVFIVNSHCYSTMDLFSKKVVSGGSGINYNASITMMLSTAKLDDKESDKIAEKKPGDYIKTGVIVTAKPEKSRFTIPQKVKFVIPFFKKPNPYVGLEEYLDWDNFGVMVGELLDEKAYNKLSDSEKKSCGEMKNEAGETCYAHPKETSKKIVVRHLGKEIPKQDLYTPEVFTDELLKKMDETVIRPNFELPSSESNNDLDELFED